MPPARSPPMAFAYESVSGHAFAVASCSTATSTGTPRPSENSPHQVARALRGDHAHVDAGRRLDVPEPNVEPVPEEQGVAVDEVGLDSLGIEMALDGSGARTTTRSASSHASYGATTAALGLGLGTALRPLRQPDPHVDTESRRLNAWACPWLP